MEKAVGKSKEGMFSWVKDEKVERLLTQYKVRWRSESIPISRINWKKSLHNQARLTQVALDEDHLLRFMISMEKQGGGFPSILVYEDKGQFVIVGGNHRAKAAEELGQEFVGAYVLLTSDSQVLDVLTRSANTWEGEPLSRIERLQQAKYFVDTYSYQITDAAAAFAMKTSALQQFILVERTRVILLSLGLNAAKLSVTTLRRLHAFHESLPVLKAAARLFITYPQSDDSMNEIFTDVMTGTSEEDRLAMIDHVSKRLSAEAPRRLGVVKLKVRTVFLKVLNATARLAAKHRSLKALQVTDRKEIDEVGRVGHFLVELSQAAVPKRGRNGK